MPSTKAKVNKMYHERQRRQLCALHSLNNLLQDSTAYSQKDLDKIAIDLSPESYLMNPHKSALGLGNYDVNVIMRALQQKNLETIWFDKRRNLDELDVDQITGFILNVHNKSWLFLPLCAKRHWYSVIKNKNDGFFYNLDSKLPAPERIGDRLRLLDFLRSQATKGCEILIVVPQSVSESQKWILPSPE